MRAAFRNRAVSRLWFGQALSTIGDEIYRVGLTWMVVGLLGRDTGLLNAAQWASLMILSFIGGHWADRWRPLTTMIRVDLIRAFIALLPVFYSYWHPVPLWLLVTVALTLSGLGAFFDPALQSMLPCFAREPAELRAATGLMSTTIRLARMVGPAIVGILSNLVPIIHFFTLDAVSFLASAASVRSIDVDVPPHHNGSEPTFWQSIAGAFRIVSTREGMPFLLWLKAITSGTWSLAFQIGIALLVRRMAGDDARAFGLTIASYGLGNVIGALYFGSHPRPNPLRLMFQGYIALGIGFVLVGAAPSIHWMMAAAAVTGLTGPMNDLAFIDHVQDRFPVAEISRVFRLRMAIETLACLVIAALSPLLFRVIGVRGTVMGCGLAWVFSGLAGFARRSLTSAPPGG